MIRVEISKEELSTGSMDAAQLVRCVDALEEDGCVLLSGVIDTEHIDALNEKMQADIDQLEERGGVENNWQGVRPPPCHPWLFTDIVFNPMAVALTHAVLGDGVTMDAYGANTAFPGCGEQAPHADGGQLWPGLTVAHPPFGLIINIPLVDVTEENGATKYWPGTHRDVGTVMKRSEQVSAERLAVWERYRGPELMTMRRGDLVVRDNRMWHAGQPNRTQTPRPMLTLIHIAPWWFRGGVAFEKGTEEFLTHPLVTVNAVFVDAPIDYLAQGHSRPLRKIVGMA